VNDHDPNDTPDSAAGRCRRKIFPVRIALGVLIALFASGCGREAAPPPRPLAARVTEILAVNTADAYVDTLALSRDGSRVAIGQRNGSIRVWTVASGTQPATFGVPRQAVLDLAFGPSGELLASLGVYRDGTLRLWRPGAGSGPWTPMASVLVGQRCNGLRFDGSGQRLGVMCEREVQIVDVARLAVVDRVTSPHREELTAFDLAANGARLITAGHEGDVIVSDATSAAPLRTFSVAASRRPGRRPPGVPAPEVWAVVVALAPDGASAAAVTSEGTVYVWDVATGQELLLDAHPEAGGPPNGSLRFAENGRLLAPTGDRRGLRLVDLTHRTWRVAGAGARAYGVVAITDDAQRFAAVTSAAKGGQIVYDVEIWKMEPG
jgi:WD40 repeat protein